MQIKNVYHSIFKAVSLSHTKSKLAASYCRSILLLHGVTIHHVDVYNEQTRSILLLRGVTIHHINVYNEQTRSGLRL